MNTTSTINYRFDNLEAIRNRIAENQEDIKSELKELNHNIRVQNMLTYGVLYFIVVNIFTQFIEKSP